MADHDAKIAQRRGRWMGYRCAHDMCTPYGICLVGPPLPEPPSRRTLPPAKPSDESPC